MDQMLPPPRGDLAPLKEPQKPLVPRQHIPPAFFRWLLRRWWGLAGTTAALVVGDLLGIPLATSPDHYWSGVQTQFGELIALATTYRWQSVIVVIVIVMLTILGHAENKRVQEDEHKRRREPIDILIRGQEQNIALDESNFVINVTNLGLTTGIKVTVDEINARVRQMEQLAAPVSHELAGATGLPLPTQFVGRMSEMNEIQHALTAGDSVGLYALAGMGGIGKSALAAKVVNELSLDIKTFPGGSAWISCDGLIGDEGLAQLWSGVARELRLADVASEPDPELLRVALGNMLLKRPMTLLALDNVELGLDAETALNTLAVPGHTAVLLTSREYVAPQRLQVLELDPLPNPDAELLFRIRLKQRNPSRPNFQDELHIAALVEAVGGLPLAVELLAAYAAANKIGLDRLLDALKNEGINAAAFHADSRRTLKLSFGRSFALLTTPQKRLFAGLSLLARNSFPRAAALALGKAAAGANEQTDPEGDLATLVYCSLVETLDGERLRLHPLLREYAKGQLQVLSADNPNLENLLGRAMLNYWLRYAMTSHERASNDLLEPEWAGLLGAINWAYEHRQFESFLVLTDSLRSYWEFRGRNTKRAEGNQVAQALGNIAPLEIDERDLDEFVTRMNSLAMDYEDLYIQWDTKRDPQAATSADSHEYEDTSQADRFAVLAQLEVAEVVKLLTEIKKLV